MRPEEVAQLAKTRIEFVQPATIEEVRAAYADRAAAVVVEVTTQGQAWYWRVGTHYYFDDPLFGDVVAIDDLRYSETLGLYDVRGFGEDQ